jgi:hypothetical protein
MAMSTRNKMVIWPNKLQPASSRRTQAQNSSLIAELRPFTDQGRGKMLVPSPIKTHFWIGKYLYPIPDFHLKVLQSKGLSI